MSLQYTKWIGKQRYHFAEIDSTNKKAKELAATGATHGTLITADTQTAGVGRRGRSWSSENETGIYMSLILRPKLKPDKASMLTLVAALAVVKAVTELLKIEQSETTLQIKWPNDIVINGKKICGILTEMILNQNQMDAVVIGIGVNVANQSFPEELADIATSLYLETGVKLDREQLINRVWEQFELYYAVVMEKGDLRDCKVEYESFLANKDEKVKILDPIGAYTGIAKGITNTGELLVDTGTKIEQVASGEVSVRGIYGYV